MRDDTAGCETLAMLIEIKPPRVGEPAGIDFEFVLYGMVSPDSPVNKLSLVFGGIGKTDFGFCENAMASIQPSIRSPNETVERFMPVIDSPAVE